MAANGVEGDITVEENVYVLVFDGWKIVASGPYPLCSSLE